MNRGDMSALRRLSNATTVSLQDAKHSGFGIDLVIPHPQLRVVILFCGRKRNFGDLGGYLGSAQYGGMEAVWSQFFYGCPIYLTMRYNYWGCATIIIRESSIRYHTWQFLN